MNRADYYQIRAKELRRQARQSRDADVKRSKLETARAFERLLGSLRNRVSRNSRSLQSLADEAMRRR